MKKYEIIIEKLSDLIDQAQPGDRLPTERELATQFQVSAMTVRQALQFLQKGGRLRSVRGSGTFVTEPRVLKSATSQSFSECMRSQGRVPGSKLLEAAMRPPSESESEKLQIDSETFVYCIKRIRLGDNIPVGIEQVILPAHLYPGLLGNNLEQSLYDILDKQYQNKPSLRSLSVRTRHADAAERAALEIKSDICCFQLQILGCDMKNNPIEITDGLYRGDQYELSVNRSH